MLEFEAAAGDEVGGRGFQSATLPKGQIANLSLGWRGYAGLFGVGGVEGDFSVVVGGYGLESHKLAKLCCKIVWRWSETAGQAAGRSHTDAVTAMVAVMERGRESTPRSFVAREFGAMPAGRSTNYLARHRWPRGEKLCVSL